MEIIFSKGLIEDARKIREEVFVQEQRFNNEFDKIDDRAYHVVLYIENNPVATGRTYKEKNAYHIGRVAVCKAYRNNHLGKIVIEALEGKIKELQGEIIILSAQKQAIGFYQKQGYQEIGKEYLDEHCKHIDMKKRI